MGTHLKVSITVPSDLLSHVSQEMQATGKSKSAVFSEALRTHFEGDEPDQLEDHERRISRLEEVAGL